MPKYAVEDSSYSPEDLRTELGLNYRRGARASKLCNYCPGDRVGKRCSGSDKTRYLPLEPDDASHQSDGCG